MKNRHIFLESYQFARSNFNFQEPSFAQIIPYHARKSTQKGQFSARHQKITNYENESFNQNHFRNFRTLEVLSRSPTWQRTSNSWHPHPLNRQCSSLRSWKDMPRQLTWSIVGFSRRWDKTSWLSSSLYLPISFLPRIQLSQGREKGGRWGWTGEIRLWAFGGKIIVGYNFVCSLSMMRG